MFDFTNLIKSQKINSSKTPRNILLLSIFFLFIFSFQNCSNFDNDSEALNCADEGCTNVEITSCLFNGMTIENGQNIRAFLESSGSSCVSEQRVCDNGNLTGSYSFLNCTSSTTNKKSCTFNGATIPDSDSVIAYQKDSVGYGTTCTQELRKCNDGVLSGSFTNATCQVSGLKSCTFNGNTVAHNGIVKAFLHSSVSYSQSCSSQNRVCNNGVLSGSYTHASCNVNAPLTCEFGGKNIAHGQSVRAYQASTVAHGSSCTATTNSEVRQCNNGSLSGSFRFSSCTVNQPQACLFNGKTIPHNGSVIGYSRSTTSFSQPCSSYSNTRVCNNGVLSEPTYKFASCQANAPRSCLFDGKTIPHTGSVMAYKQSSAAYGQCRNHQSLRICRDGTLDLPAYIYASCTEAQPKSCLFNGKTIPHNDTELAYFTATSPRLTPGQAPTGCRSEFRSCKNGVLSGTAQYSSCTFNYPDCKYGSRIIKEGQHIKEFGVAPHWYSGIAYYEKFLPEVIITKVGSVNVQPHCKFTGVMCQRGELVDVTIQRAHNNNKCANPRMHAPVNRTTTDYGMAIGNPTKDKSGKGLKTPYNYSD